MAFAELLPKEMHYQKARRSVLLCIHRSSDSRFIAGISASSAMVLLGNLGVVRMLYQGFQQVAAPGGLVDKANIFQRILWTD